MHRIIAVIFFAIVFSSCKHKSKTEIIVYKAAEEGLEQSSKTISYSTKTYLVSIDQKLSEPSTAVIAAIWQPKAALINVKTSATLKYLDLLTDQLKREAGGSIQNGEAILNDDNLDAVSRVFFDQKKGVELYQKLIQYKQDILEVDPGIKKEFSKNAIITTSAFDLDSNNKKNFTQTFFKDIPAIAAVSVLSKFKNNVRRLENEMIAYCYSQIGTMGWIFNVYDPLITQNSKQLRAGDKIKITAGIGAYVSAAKPTITINGKVFDKSSFDGFVTFEVKVPLKAGKYSIPVKFDYVDELRRNQTVIQKVEYTVVE